MEKRSNADDVLTDFDFLLLDFISKLLVSRQFGENEYAIFEGFFIINKGLACAFGIYNANSLIALHSKEPLNIFANIDLQNDIEFLELNLLECVLPNLELLALLSNDVFIYFYDNEEGSAYYGKCRHSGVPLFKEAPAKELDIPLVIVIFK